MRNNCLNTAKIGNLDVIEFKMAYFIKRNFRRIENNLDPIDNLYKRIIYQPELKYKFVKITQKEKLWNYLNRSICSKLIKNDIQLYSLIINYNNNFRLLKIFGKNRNLIERILKSGII